MMVKNGVREELLEFEVAANAENGFDDLAGQGESRDDEVDYESAEETEEDENFTSHGGKHSSML
jgi:hypothetical protein